MNFIEWELEKTERDIEISRLKNSWEYQVGKVRGYIEAKLEGIEDAKDSATQSRR